MGNSIFWGKKMHIKIRIFVSVLFVLISLNIVNANIGIFDVEDGPDGWVQVTRQSQLVKHAADMSEAAYNPVDEISPYSYPTSKRINNPIRDEFKKGGDYYSFKSANGSQAGFVKYEHKNGIHNFSIAFHGTESYQDALTDIDARKASGRPINIEGTVHKGMLDRYLESQQELKAIMNKVIKNKGIKLGKDDVEMLVTGHSLGGAEAIAAATDLQGEYPEIIVNTTTFNAPRFFSHNAAEYVRENVLTKGKHYRIWREGDPVSTIGLGFPWVDVPFYGIGYKHFGQSFKLESEYKELSKSPSNHSLKLMRRDADKFEEVKVQQHTGWKTWMLGITKKISGAIFG